MTNRSPEREQFLSDLLISAIEHQGYGFPGILEYHWQDRKPAEVYAVIYDRYEESPDSEDWKPKTSWRVDIDTIARGIGVLRKKYPSTVSGYMRDLFEADRENDAGQIDVVGALAILEAAVFGDITYN